MNKKVYIKQDGTIPGHRIIEELIRRGGANEYELEGDQKNVIYYINNGEYEARREECIIADSFSPDGFTQLLYNKEADTFYEKSQRMAAGEAKESLLPNKSTLSEKEKETIREKITYILPEIESFAIPDGYDAVIEDGKVIVRKKKWHPSAHETFFMVASMCDYPHFIVEDCDWVGDDQDHVKLDHNNVFHTEAEAQTFCDKLNDAISQILENRKKEEEK